MISGGPPEGEPWVWLTREMTSSSLWAALGIAARRTLDALIIENMSHAGRQNGSLVATYTQLERQGVTRADIHKGLEELIVCGFVKKTYQGLRVAGHREPSRYALTWLPTYLHSEKTQPATDEWRGLWHKLHNDGVRDAREVRSWLKQRVDARGMRSKRRRSTRDIDSNPQLRGDDQLQVRGGDAANVVPLTTQLRGGAVLT